VEAGTDTLLAVLGAAECSLEPTSGGPTREAWGAPGDAGIGQRRPGHFGTLLYNPADMRDAPLPDLILYGRSDCQLCDETRAMVVALLGQRADAGQLSPRLVERDIDANPGWQRAYFESIPVVELGDRRLEVATSLARIRGLLSDVLD
jgi:Glutaredoxin-like domain (DUF836)